MRLMSTTLLIVLSGLWAPALAQDFGLLVGTLHESQTEHPLADARVRIMALGIDQEFSTTTDSKGRFAYVGLSSGKYLVTITKPGYAPIDVFDVLIDRSETTHLRLKMTRAAHAPFKRRLIRYRRPLIHRDDASLTFVYRPGE